MIEDLVQQIIRALSDAAVPCDAETAKALRTVARFIEEGESEWRLADTDGEEESGRCTKTADYPSVGGFVTRRCRFAAGHAGRHSFVGRKP